MSENICAYTFYVICSCRAWLTRIPQGVLCEDGHLIFTKSAYVKYFFNFACSFLNIFCIS
jgi:hypothetical protein